VEAAVAQFPENGPKAEQLGVAVAELDRARRSYRSGSYRGAEPMYPASVVKLFYLAYAAELLERKRLRLTPELERGVRDMIVESSNDATGLVLDAVTGTTGGPELAPKALALWMERRQAVNKWYASMGYTGINACQKTWNEGPYGRERQGYGPKFELRNMLTPNACLRLMAEIALDKIVNPRQCEWMRGYLRRKVASEEGADYQSRQFTGEVLPKGAGLWSKAGYTSEVRHDVAYVRALDGREFVLAVFTKGHSGNTKLVPFLAQELLRGLKAIPDK
jgi:beta-lactamase class A